MRLQGLSAAPLVLKRKPWASVLVHTKLEIAAEMGGFLWDLYRMCMGCGILMRYFHGILIGYLFSLGFPFFGDYNWMFMGYLWDFNGTEMGSSGISKGFLNEI